MIQHLKSNFYIFNGGPGSGKTSVLNALKQQGYLTVSEVGRKIIQEQTAVGGNITHTGDRIAFREKMLDYSIADFFDHANINETAFFDRGISCCWNRANP